MKAAPFTNISYESRTRERHRRLLLTTFASVGGRLVALLTVLISVPMAANYLGTERYGLWAAIGSLIALLSFADLGIGSGLLNAITECHGRDDMDAARQYVASAVAMLTGVAILLGLAFVCMYPWISLEASVQCLGSTGRCGSRARNRLILFLLPCKHSLRRNSLRPAGIPGGFHRQRMDCRKQAARPDWSFHCCAA